MCLSGEGAKDIARLNVTILKTLWRNSILNILHNAVYTGRLIWNKNNSEDRL